MGRTSCRAVSRDRMLLERRKSGRVFQKDSLDSAGLGLKTRLENVGLGRRMLSKRV